MLNIIVGNNASGKSVTLRNRVLDCKGSYLYNQSKIDRRDLFAIVKERLELIEDICPEYDFNPNTPTWCSPENEGVTMQFVEILNYICRDAEVIFLDDPEFLLSMVERRNLYEILEVLSPVCEIWVATNDEYLRNGSLWDTVKRYYPIKNNGDFVLCEMGRKDAYKDIM